METYKPNLHSIPLHGGARTNNHHNAGGGVVPPLHVFLVSKTSRRSRATKQPRNTQTQKHRTQQKSTSSTNPFKHLPPIQRENPLPRNHGRRFGPGSGPKPVSPLRPSPLHQRRRHLPPIQRPPSQGSRQNLGHVPQDSNFRHKIRPQPSFPLPIPRSQSPGSRFQESDQQMSKILDFKRRRPAEAGSVLSPPARLQGFARAGLSRSHFAGLQCGEDADSKTRLSCEPRFFEG